MKPPISRLRLLEPAKHGRECVCVCVSRWWRWGRVYKTTQSESFSLLLAPPPCCDPWTLTCTQWHHHSDITLWHHHSDIITVTSSQWHHHSDIITQWHHSDIISQWHHLSDIITVTSFHSDITQWHHSDIISQWHHHSDIITHHTACVY